MCAQRLLCTDDRQLVGGAWLGADRGLVQAEVKVPGDMGRKGFAMRTFLFPADLGKATHPSAPVSPSSERTRCLLDTEVSRARLCPKHASSAAPRVGHPRTRTGRLKVGCTGPADSPSGPVGPPGGDRAIFHPFMSTVSSEPLATWKVINPLLIYRLTAGPITNSLEGITSLT